jgi:short-subunit dehydrogenase
MAKIQKTIVIGGSSEIVAHTLKALTKRHYPLDEVAYVVRNPKKLPKDKSFQFKEIVFQIQDSSEICREDIIEYASECDLMIIAQGMLPREYERNNIQKITDVNFTDPAKLLTRVCKSIPQIAVISSMAGTRGRKTNFEYGAAKAALSTFIEGIRATTASCIVELKPGPVKTKMTQHLPKEGNLWITPERAGKRLAKAIAHREEGTIYTGIKFLILDTILKFLPSSKLPE